MRSTLFAIPLSILGNNCIKSKIKANGIDKVFEILGHLLNIAFSYSTCFNQAVGPPFLKTYSTARILGIAFQFC